MQPDHPERAAEDRAHVDLYGHRGKGGVWQPGLGPCICKVCEQERADALNARIVYHARTTEEERDADRD